MTRATRIGMLAVLLVSVTGAAKARPHGNEVVVQMTDQLTFEPATVRIKAGQTVVWRNTSSVMHTVTANKKLAADANHVQLPNGAKPFNSGELIPGTAFTHKFTVPGTYRYVCLPHEFGGMMGTVEVAR